MSKTPAKNNNAAVKLFANNTAKPVKKAPPQDKKKVGAAAKAKYDCVSLHKRRFEEEARASLFFFLNRNHFCHGSPDFWRA